MLRWNINNTELGDRLKNTTLKITDLSLIRLILTM